MSPAHGQGEGQPPPLPTAYRHIGVRRDHRFARDAGTRHFRLHLSGIFHADSAFGHSDYRPSIVARIHVNVNCGPIAGRREGRPEPLAGIYFLSAAVTVRTAPQPVPRVSPARCRRLENG